MKSIKKGIFVFLVVDIVLIIFSLYMGGVWLINTQGGFISSMIIILCSFYGYKKVIDKKVEYFDTEAMDDDRDLIDKTLDKYELWEEEDKPKTKFESIKTSFKNAKSFSLGFFSLYRLFGYIILISLCVFLAKKEIFNPIAFFVGISSTIIFIVVYAILGLKHKEWR